MQLDQLSWVQDEHSLQFSIKKKKHSDKDITLLQNDNNLSLIPSKNIGISLDGIGNTINANTWHNNSQLPQTVQRDNIRCTGYLFIFYVFFILVLSLQHWWDGHRKHPKGRADHGLAVWSSGPGDASWRLHHSHLQGLSAAALCPDGSEQQRCQPLQQR